MEIQTTVEDTACVHVATAYVHAPTAAVGWGPQKVVVKKILENQLLVAPQRSVGPEHMESEIQLTD